MKSKKWSRVFLTFLLNIFIFLTSSVAIAMTSGMTEKNSIFKITSKFLVDGKIVSSPIIQAKANQKAFIVLTDTNNSLRVELKANNIAKFGINDSIEINYDIQYKNIDETMQSKPQIVVKPMQERRFKLASNLKHSYEMYVIAERVE